MAVLPMEDAWINDWNDIIRNVFFKDDVLMDMMEIPKTTKIVEFIERYFIRTGTSSVILKDEPVRIVYSFASLGSLGEKATKNILSFDIYVKDKYQHTYGRDALMCRTELIAYRLRTLLMTKRYNGVYRFYEPSEGDMHTSTVGYSRYNLSLLFTKVY